jgi:hypothetical protein
MGEVFNALARLNTTLKLGLTGDQLLRAEGSFKSELAMRANFPRELATGTALAENWEIVTYLRPRETRLSMTRLQELAKMTATTGATTGTIGGSVLTKAVTSGAARSPKKSARKSSGRKRAE